jgi:hypothetical protein
MTKQATARIITWTRSTWLGVAHADYPLIDVGVLELNQNLHNIFRILSKRHSRPHIVDGIGYSPIDVATRILSYPDAQRYRLGTNYEQISVNRCPFNQQLPTWRAEAHGRKWKRTSSRIVLTRCKLIKHIKNPFEDNSRLRLVLVSLWRGKRSFLPIGNYLKLCPPSSNKAP